MDEALTPSIDILICTIDTGVVRVPEVLLPPMAGVGYVVSMQYTDERYLSLVPEVLTQRADVRLTRLEGRGLSRNRNHALAHSSADIALIADDDVRLTADGLRAIADTYRRHPQVDIALFRVTDYDGRLFKRYPPTPTAYPMALRQGYYPCSWEITMRHGVPAAGVQFNPLFGLGSAHLASGEEDVLLCDALRQGMDIRVFPTVIGQTDPASTGTRFLTDRRVQRSKGATFAYCYGRANAVWRSVKESLHYFIYKGKNPFPIFHQMMQGIRYAHRHCTLPQP